MTPVITAAAQENPAEGVKSVKIVVTEAEMAEMMPITPIILTQPILVAEGPLARVSNLLRI